MEINRARKYIYKNFILRFDTQKHLDDHDLVFLETKIYQYNKCEFRVKIGTELRMHINGQRLDKTISVVLSKMQDQEVRKLI